MRVDYSRIAPSQRSHNQTESNPVISLERLKSIEQRIRYGDKNHETTDYRSEWLLKASNCDIEYIAKEMYDISNTAVSVIHVPHI